jgi:hypothetical protein
LLEWQAHSTTLGLRWNLENFLLGWPGTLLLPISTS